MNNNYKILEMAGRLNDLATSSFMLSKSYALKGDFERATRYSKECEVHLKVAKMYLELFDELEGINKPEEKK